MSTQKNNNVFIYMIINHIYNIIRVSLIMALIDSFYLVLMSSFFNKIVSKIQGSPISLKITPTLLVYIFLVFQLYYFILINARSYSHTTLYKLILNSFILGVTTYGVYEYTNNAIFKNWPFEATIYDTLWGGVLFSLTSTVYYVLQK